MGEVLFDELPGVGQGSLALAARVVVTVRGQGASSAPQKYAIVPGWSSSAQGSTARSWSIDAQVLNGWA